MAFSSDTLRQREAYARETLSPHISSFVWWKLLLGSLIGMRAKVLSEGLKWLLPLL